MKQNDVISMILFIICAIGLMVSFAMHKLEPMIFFGFFMIVNQNTSNGSVHM